MSGRVGLASVPRPRRIAPAAEEAALRTRSGAVVVASDSRTAKSEASEECAVGGRIARAAT